MPACHSSLVKFQCALFTASKLTIPRRQVDALGAVTCTARAGTEHRRGAEPSVPAPVAFPVWPQHENAAVGRQRRWARCVSRTSSPLSVPAAVRGARKARPAPRAPRRHGPAGKSNGPKGNEVRGESGHSAPHFMLGVLLKAWRGPARPSDSRAEPDARARCAGGRRPGKSGVRGGTWVAGCRVRSPAVPVATRVSHSGHLSHWVGGEALSRSGRSGSCALSVMWFHHPLLTQWMGQGTEGRVCAGDTPGRAWVCHPSLELRPRADQVRRSPSASGAVWPPG